jgi:hypothetical protein
MYSQQVMKPKLFLGLALVLSVVIVNSIAADSKDFGSKHIDAIWPELWQPGSPPKIEPLSEQQVIAELIGQWNVDFVGPDKTIISLKTNCQVSVGGNKDGKAWGKNGEWKVISGKIILFLPDDSMPSFIFRKDGKIYIFDPWAKNMMAEMQRPIVPSPPLTNNSIATPLQDEGAKAYFKDYLAKCATNEIRCLWFLQDNPKVGMVMAINFNEESVSTAREVYNWAVQSLETRKLSHAQILNLKKIISSLPASDKNADFNKSVFVSIRNGTNVEVLQYDRQHAPGIVQRIYDIGGGYLN